MYQRPLSPRPSKVTVIDHPDKVGQAVEKLLRYDALGYDIETYNKFDRHIPAFHPASGARTRLAQFTTPEAEAYVFDCYKVDPRSWVYYMFPNRYTAIIQNAKFECKFLQHEFGIYEFGPIFDTLLAEQVCARGRVAYGERGYLPVGLDSIAKRRLDVIVPKDEQASDWYKETLSEDQIFYAAMDSTVVLPIWQSQCETLVEQQQVRVAELEFGAVPAYAWMENNGFTFDTEAWMALLQSNIKRLDEIKQELWHLIGKQNTLFRDIPTINLNAREKVQLALEEAGIPLPVDDDGNVTLSNQLLRKLHEEGTIRAVDLYIEYVKIAKKISSFGKKWVNMVNPYTGRIHCNLKQIGAETGRSAAGSPNLMQIPKEDEYRNCFTARPGWCLNDADYSQCELRILAEYCRDRNLLNAFDTGKDLHYYTGFQLFHEIRLDVTDEEILAVVDKEQRGTAKNMNFLIVYGGGPYKLAWSANIAIEVAEQVMAHYLNNVYPGMNTWLDKQAREVCYNGLEARTMTNRLRKYAGDLNDRKFKSSVQRHAKNFPIQGTNADITKLALTQTYREIVNRKLVDNIKMILPVHDELVVESQPQYAMAADDIMCRQMLSAEGQYLRRVPCVVDSDISLRWYKDVPEEAKLEAQRLIGASLN